MNQGHEVSRLRDTVAAQKLRELVLLAELFEAPIGERHRHRALSNRPGDPLREQHRLRVGPADLVELMRLYAAILVGPGWRNSVRRDRLKPDCPRGRVGSNPTPGT